MCRENLVAGKFLRYSKTLHVTSTLVFLWYNDGYEYLSTFSIDQTIDFWIVAKIIDAFMKIGFEPVMNGERCVRGARLVTPAIFKYSLR